MVIKVLRHRKWRRASHPLWDCSLATPNPSSNGHTIQEEAVHMVALQVPAGAAVDETDARTTPPGLSVLEAVQKTVVTFGFHNFDADIFAGADEDALDLLKDMIRFAKRVAALDSRDGVSCRRPGAASILTLVEVSAPSDALRSSTLPMFARRSHSDRRC
jgi:hypothetical protein